MENNHEISKEKLNIVTWNTYLYAVIKIKIGDLSA